MASEAGDFIGRGRTYSYTQANAVLTAAVEGSRLTFTVTGDQRWRGEFQLPRGYTDLRTGVYGGLTRYPFNDPVIGGLSWTGEGRGCNRLTGSITILKVAYVGSALTEIELQFEQYCEGGSPALRGEIYWNAGDTTAAPGPVSPPPAGLWQPPSGSTPATGSYVYLESQPGDYIGAGATHLYTNSTAALMLAAHDARVSVTVDGDQKWSGAFVAMNSTRQLIAGYYPDLAQFVNPTRGGLSWSGEGRACNTLTGWFVVDRIVWSGSTLAAIELRFEQHCEGAGPALRGKVRWDANDPTAPPGPVAPPPAGLWQPAAGTSPATGNYVHLDSQLGDFVGAGGRYSYTSATALIRVTTSGSRLTVTVDGDESWGGEFQPMNSLSRLQAGYYGDLQRYPFQNPVKGGLNWSGEGRGCNRLNGWFVVDDVVYSGPTLTSIDLRFEQRCEGTSAALRGKIRWRADDATVPPGPVVPAPANLWRPAAQLPAAGSFVYLQSPPGDYIGGGADRLYTTANGPLSVSASGATLTVEVADWIGTFAGMDTLDRLEAGYYGDLRRYSFHNPVKGGLEWFGEARGCNRLTGWFVVDSVAYSGAMMTAIDLRFEQLCEGSTAPLRGRIRWSQ